MKTIAAALLTALALSVTPVASAVAAPAAAGRTHPHPESWQPVTQQSFTAPAGKYCSFAFTYVPDRQALESRVLARYPDGAERAVEYRGLLVGTTTNLTTGASIQRDSSGTAVEEYRADGTLSAYTSLGPVGLGFQATDGYPQGYYQLGGLHRVRFAPDGTKTMTLDRGPEENICTTLG